VAVARAMSINLIFFFSLLFLVRPEAIVFGADLNFTAVYFFLISTRDLRDASADRREILHGDQ